MNYQLICSDIDGTLLNKDRELSSRTIQAFKKLSHIPTVLISSRMPKAMTHLQAELDILSQPLIAYNGGLILTYENDQPTTLLSIEITIEITQQILEFIQDMSIHMSLYHNDDWYVPAMDYWANREANNTKVQPTVANLKEVCANWKAQGIGPHKIMCMGPEEEMQRLADWLSAQHGNNVHSYRSKPTYIEIASKQISKLSALSHLLAHKYEMDLASVIAFGDNYNDVEMIGGVGCGVAVANAKDDVKAVANRHTLGNKEDGVAASLEEIFQL